MTRAPPAGYDVRRKRDLHPNDAIAPKAGIGAGELREAVDQQPSRHREHECERELADDERRDTRDARRAV